jgi:hypothetical protein
MNGILRMIRHKNPETQSEEKLAEMVADRIEAMIDQKIHDFLKNTGRLK